MTGLTTQELAGRHALVCGASRGIGRAIAVALAQRGAQVTALARSTSALTELAAQLPRAATAPPHAWIATDLGDGKALAPALEQLCARHAVEIVVNNGGGPPPGTAADATPEAYEQALHAHLFAAQMILAHVLPGMRAAGYGRIVNILSTSVKCPIPGLAASNLTRAAMASWAVTLAGELAGAGITVNNVLPGFIRTDRLRTLLAAEAEQRGVPLATLLQETARSIPAGRLGTAEDIAALVAFLCSPAAGYITGTSIPVDGGRTGTLS